MQAILIAPASDPAVPYAELAFPGAYPGFPLLNTPSKYPDFL